MRTKILPQSCNILVKSLKSNLYKADTSIKRTRFWGLNGVCFREISLYSVILSLEEKIAHDFSKFTSVRLCANTSKFQGDTIEIPQISITKITTLFLWNLSSKIRGSIKK